MPIQFWSLILCLLALWGCEHREQVKWELNAPKMIPWRKRHSVPGKPYHSVVLCELTESCQLCPAHIADLQICLWHQMLRVKCNIPFHPQVTFTFQAEDGTQVGVLQVDFLHQLIGTPDPMNWTLSPGAFDRLQTIASECQAYRELI